MLYLTRNTEIYLASKPVDFRKQIDGLAALCTNTLKQNPRSGQLFVFINKAKTHIKILCYENNGYWLATKRLSRGKYILWPNNKFSANHVIAHELIKILKTNVAS